MKIKESENAIESLNEVASTNKTRKSWKKEMS